MFFPEAAEKRTISLIPSETVLLNSMISAEFISAAKDLCACTDVPLISQRAYSPIKRPLFPPSFFTRRISVIRIPRSMALHIS